MFADRKWPERDDERPVRRSRWSLRTTLMFGLATTLLVAGVMGVHKLGRARRWQSMGRLVAEVVTRDSLVALTIDDGPAPAVIQALVDTLRAHDAHATFFVTGSELSRSPSSAALLLEAGHELGNHTWSHRRMAFVSLDTIISEIERTDSLIRKLGQETPIYFRAPYGYKLIGLPWYLSHTGRTNVMWSIEPDSYDLTPAQMVRHVLERVHPGSIILFHAWYPSRAASRTAIGPLVDSLHARGYRVTTVRALLGKGPHKRTETAGDADRTD